MIKTACIVFFSAFSANLCAFELEGVKVAGIKELPQPAITAPEPAAAEKVSSQYIWLRINNYTAGGIQAYDYSLKLDVVVRKTSAGYFYVDSGAGAGESYGRGVIRVYGKDYQLTGDGMSLDLKRAGGGYAVSGNVRGDNNQYQFISLTFSDRSDAFSYDISGYGMYLSSDRGGISGTFDAGRYSKKALSAVASLLLALQLDAQQPQVNP
ncbi:MAG: hypothetical protein Q7R35_14195 [Elusimicrobiota bacterium]|nr:hypothetical protein [Elusimicrobiota bacterium]